MKGADKDIGRYKGPLDLSRKIQEIEDILEKDVNEQIRKALKGKDVTIHYEDSSHIVLSPKTFDVAKIIGSREWCTSRSKSMYSEYADVAPLYILLIKDGDNFSDEKYQLHFPSMQFMDKNDDPVLDELENMPLLRKVFSDQPEFNSNLGKKEQIKAVMETCSYLSNHDLSGTDMVTQFYQRFIMEKISIFLLCVKQQMQNTPYLIIL